MATAGELLVSGSTAPDGSTAGVHLQNLGGGSTETVASEYVEVNIDMVDLTIEPDLETSEVVDIQADSLSLNVYVSEPEGIELDIVDNYIEVD